MPADRETRLARRWDRLDEPRTSGSQFRGRCRCKSGMVAGLLQSLQFSELLLVARFPEDFALSRPLINPRRERWPVG